MESNDSSEIPDTGETSEDFTVTNYVKSSQEFVPLLDSVSFPMQLLKVMARVHHTERRLKGSRCRTEYTFALPANSLILAIQEDLDGLCDWSESWQLSLRPQKCKVLKLGQKKSEAQYTM